MALIHINPLKNNLKCYKSAIYESKKCDEMATDNFISSVVLATKLGINQKSAWLYTTNKPKSDKMSEFANFS